MKKKFTFKKEERLKSWKIIEQLFEKKNPSITEAPFKIVWTETILKSKFPAQIVFAVPKKNFHRAVDRNKIRRWMREYFRMNKYILYDVLTEKKKQLALMLLYTGKKIPDFNLVSEKIIVILNRLSEIYE